MPKEAAAVGIERIQTRLVKRREGDQEPYEVIETDTHYDKDGKEIEPSAKDESTVNITQVEQENE